MAEALYSSVAIAAGHCCARGVSDAHGRRLRCVRPAVHRMPTSGGPLLMRCLLKRAMLRKVGCNAAGRFGAEDGQPRSIAWNPAHASLYAMP